MANPISYILYISIRIFFSAIVFLNSSNHSLRPSFIISLRRAASIVWEDTVSNSGLQCIKCCTQVLPIVSWHEGELSIGCHREDRIFSASSRIKGCFNGCSRIARRVTHSAKAFSSEIVRICCHSCDSAVDLLPPILRSNVTWLTSLGLAASWIDRNQRLASSYRPFLILLSHSARFWLLRTGIVVIVEVQWKFLNFTGPYWDLVQIVTGYSSGQNGDLNK